MISSVFKKVFIGGALKPIVPVKLNSFTIILSTIIIAIIDLFIRAFILEYGYKTIVKKTKVNLPKLDLMDCLLLIIIVICLFRN